MRAFKIGIISPPLLMEKMKIMPSRASPMIKLDDDVTLHEEIQEYGDKYAPLKGQYADSHLGRPKVKERRGSSNEKRVASSEGSPFKISRKKFEGQSSATQRVLKRLSIVAPSSGILSIIVGVLMVIFPSGGVFDVMYWVSAYYLLLGILLVALGVRLRMFGRSSSPPEITRVRS